VPLEAATCFTMAGSSATASAFFLNSAMPFLCSSCRRAQSAAKEEILLSVAIHTPSARPNLDAVRTDHFGVYGGEDQTATWAAHRPSGAKLIGDLVLVKNQPTLRAALVQHAAANATTCRIFAARLSYER
jgi:hypothetical protein